MMDTVSSIVGVAGTVSQRVPATSSQRMAHRVARLRKILLAYKTRPEGAAHGDEVDGWLARLAQLEAALGLTSVGTRASRALHRERVAGELDALTAAIMLTLLPALDDPSSDDP
jgi:hypothetical protein